MTNHREGHESHVAPDEHVDSSHIHTFSDTTQLTLFGEKDEADKAWPPSIGRKSNNC